MKYTELFSEVRLYEMIGDGYVSVREHPEEPGLRILNYTEKAQYEKIWNEVTENCRGLILTGSNDVLARPWKKFYNLGERPCPIGNHSSVEIVDKMDGSLGIFYQWEDEHGGLHPAIATRGSFTSDQAVWATKWLQENHNSWGEAQLGHWTPLFEIIYPENRIVLDYGDFEGLVLLGAREVYTGNIVGPKAAQTLLGWEGQIAQTFSFLRLGDFLESPVAKRKNAEGVVVRSGDVMVKIKQEDYVALHALVFGLNNRRIWEWLTEFGEIGEFIAPLPDEFQNWAFIVATNLRADYQQWKSERIEEYEEIVGHPRFAPTSRKEFAEIAQDYPFPGALFKLYDGREIDSMAWAAVRPAEITRPYGGMK